MTSYCSFCRSCTKDLPYRLPLIFFCCTCRAHFDKFCSFSPFIDDFGSSLSRQMYLFYDDHWEQYLLSYYQPLFLPPGTRIVQVTL